MTKEERILDILKIQKTIRKAIKDYVITARYDEEVLISFISVDLYLNLTEDSNPTKPPSHRKATPHPEVVVHGQTKSN